MEKNNKVLLVINLLLAIVLIIGIISTSIERNKIQDNIVQEVPNDIVEENNDVEDDQVKAEVISKSDEKLNTEDLTLLSRTEFDMDNDGQLEYIEMYTAAERNEDGEMMWDDGQNWVLIFKDGDNEYQLFNGYVQIGELRYWAYTADDNNEFHITTVMTQTASLILSDFTFDKDSESFNKTELFTPVNVNMLGYSY